MVILHQTGRAISTGSKLRPHQCVKSIIHAGGQSGYWKLSGFAMINCSTSTIYVMKIRLIQKKTRMTMSPGRFESVITSVSALTNFVGLIMAMSLDKLGLFRL